MTIKNWLNKNTENLSGKLVAITGSTGGIGKELSAYLAEKGANLVLIDRNLERSSENKKQLQERFKDIEITLLTLNLEDTYSLKSTVEKLIELDIDIFIHNAGAYSVKRKLCDSGYDNLFQINFLSPYYIIRGILPHLRKKKGKVVVVSSIAHNYCRLNENDIDFKNVKANSLAYGNAKRFLTFSLFELFKNEKDATLSVAHPGISFTGITNHYPKLIFFFIKYPMKIIFMKPKKAALPILKGVFDTPNYSFWLGPKWFNIWGLPKKKKLKTADTEERKKIYETAEKIYLEILKEYN